MRKMHLTARPANEGARKLARWIARECHGNMDLAAQLLRTGAATLERLLAGEITPGEPLARAIGEGTRHRVLGIHGVARIDWQRDAVGGWFDVPNAAAARVAA